MGEACPTTASAADVCRNFGLWQDRALKGPVMVTNHGRAKTVLLSIDAYGAVGEGGPGAGAAEVLERMGECYVALDERLHVIVANRAASTHLREPAEALLGRGLGDLFGTLAVAVLERILMRVATSGETRRFEATGRDGRSLRIEAFALGGGVGLIFAPAEADIETVARLAEQEALGALLIANGQAGIGRLGVRGFFAGTGASLTGLIGFSRDQLLRARLVDIVTTGCREVVGEAVEAVLSDGETAAIDGAIVTRDGREVPVTMALAPTRTAYAIDGAALLVTPLRVAEGRKSLAA